MPSALPAAASSTAAATEPMDTTAAPWRLEGVRTVPSHVSPCRCAHLDSNVIVSSHSGG